MCGGFVFGIDYGKEFVGLFFCGYIFEVGVVEIDVIVYVIFLRMVG